MVKTISKKQLLEIKILKSLCKDNFSNRLLFQLSGLEDIVSQEEYKDYRHWIDGAYQIIQPELKKDTTKPSRALVGFVFIDSLRQKDYQTIINMSQTATAEELKEFLSLEVPYKPKEQVADFLTFPLLALMAQNLKPSEKSNLLLSYPQLIKECFPDIRTKTIKELITSEDRVCLEEQASKELKPLLNQNLEIKMALPTSWEVHFSTGLSGGLLDRRIVQAQGKWVVRRIKRESEKQIGVAAYLQKWQETHQAQNERS